MHFFEAFFGVKNVILELFRDEKCAEMA